MIQIKNEDCLFSPIDIEIPNDIIANKYHKDIDLEKISEAIDTISLIEMADKPDQKTAFIIANKLIEITKEFVYGYWYNVLQYLSYLESPLYKDAYNAYSGMEKILNTMTSIPAGLAPKVSNPEKYYTDILSKILDIITIYKSVRKKIAASNIAHVNKEMANHEMWMNKAFMTAYRKFNVKLPRSLDI